MNYSFKKSYLLNHQPNRRIDFEDIILESNIICENIILTALETAEITEAGIQTKLEEINCSDIDIYIHSDGSIEGSCILNYTPNSKYCITAPFIRDVHFCLKLGNEPLFTYGFGAFTITTDGAPQLVDFDSLYDYYIKHPEQFDKSLFCNF